MGPEEREWTALLIGLAALVPTLVNLELVLLYAPSGEIRQLTVNLLYYSKL